MSDSSSDANVLVDRLRVILGADPTLTLVLLHGSRARGGARPDSDIDLIVDAWDSSNEHLLGIGHQIQDKLGITVEIAPLADERMHAPAMLLDALDHGVAVIDRADAYAHLHASRHAIEADALSETASRREAVIQAFQSLGAHCVRPFIDGSCGGPLVDGLTRNA
jgi:predicted nucleotidyltransferase